MGKIFTDVKSATKNIGKNISFLQPIYEALINSIESGAKNISIKLFESSKIDAFDVGYIEGFEIQDDGEGFIEKNRIAFCTLWSENRIKSGGKGSGRFTWLSVYKNIHINSNIASTSETVDFDFNMDFSSESIRVISQEHKSNLTTITFSNLVKTTLKGKEYRELADLNSLKNNILEHLLLRLHYLKKHDKSLNIKLSNANSNIVLTLNDVPDLEIKYFSIKGFDEKDYPFELHYHFTKDKNNSKRMILCADDRAIKTFDGDDMDFSASLPDKSSFKLFVVSSYLNERNSDSRNDFEILEGLKSTDLINPISISMIKSESIIVLNTIINEKYPNLLDCNQKEIDIAIEEAPQLKSYILRNKDVLKDHKSLVKKATSQYKKDKKALDDKYEKLTRAKNFNSEDFHKTINDMANIAAIELAQYVVYRNKIIEGLENVVNDKTSLEKDIHNLIMRQRTQSNNEDYMNRNLWIFDDKFMTYQYAASDTEIDKICDKLNKVSGTDISLKRPDLFISYNKEEGNKDAVVIELKGVNADLDEKYKSFREISDYIGIIREEIPTIETVYGYVITKIDEDFAKSIERDGRFTKLMSEDCDKRMYYGYIGPVNAHIYVTDIEVIINDAKLRNDTFIKILKKHSYSE